MSSAPNRRIGSRIRTGGLQSVVLIGAYLWTLGCTDEPRDRVGTERVAPIPDTVRYRLSWTGESANGEPLFRPATILVIRDGSVWVSDAGNARIYRWTDEGEPLEPIGTKGAGPGELQVPTVLVRLRGDTVAIWDRPLQRLTGFLAGGSVAATWNIRITPSVHGFLRGFHRRAAGWTVWTVRYPTAVPRPGDDRSYVWAVDADGIVVDSVLALLGPETVIDRDSAGSTRIDAPFQRKPVIIFLDDGSILAGYTAHDRLERYDSIGRRIDELDLRLPELPVTETERRAFVDSLAKALESTLDRARLDAGQRASFRIKHRRLLSGLEFPRTHPRYVRIVLDDGERLWVQLPTRKDAPFSQWWVYDADSGRLSQVVQVPRHGTVTAAAVARDELFVVETDSLGLPRVAHYVPASANHEQRNTATR